MQWEPQGSPNQKQIVYDALQRCTFDFGQIAQDRVVPVEWENLSRYYSSDAKQITEDNHVHLANGDVGHPIEARARVLGLAWYSGKISLDLYCEPRPDLAHEVFLSEGAHMLDFFWMQDRHRVMVWNALHPELEDLPINTSIEEEGSIIAGDEGWFDVGDYSSWIGEAWMGLFVKAYSDIPVTIPFRRPPTAEAVKYVRKNLTPFFSSKSGRVHDSHKGQVPVLYHPLLPMNKPLCGICKPKEW
jgi:hypothetical protein